MMIAKKSWAQDTPNMRDQMKKIMTDKKSRNAIEQKISSQLLQAIREKRATKKDQSGLEPVNINADKDGNLNVDIKADVTDSLISRIKALGGTIIFASKEYRSLRARINLSMVESIAAASEVRFVEPAAIPRLNGL